MCEQRVRTRVRTDAGWRGLQEFLVADRGEPAIEASRAGGHRARPSPRPEVLAAIEGADAIVIGPSNPVISIGPILAIDGLREALVAAPAPVVAVSPFVAGAAVKGPTDAFMRALGRPSSAAGVASMYEGLIDGMVCDEDDPEAARRGRVARLPDADGGTRWAPLPGRSDP